MYLELEHLPSLWVPYAVYLNLQGTTIQANLTLVDSAKGKLKGAYAERMAM